MVSYRTIGLILIILMSLFSPVIAIYQPVQTKNAKFVLAGWDYPDEYWQGIKGINIYENSTGSWVLKYGTIEPDDDTTFDWVAGVAIKLRVWTDLNSTLVGVSTTAEGQLYLRHSVNVTHVSTNVFSQQNFTYFGVSTEAEIYTYSYDVVLDFIPAEGSTYIAMIDYEIYYGFIFQEATSKATSGDAGYTPINDYTYTHSDLMTDYGGTSPVLESYVIINFTLPAEASTIVYFDYNVNCAGGNDDDFANFSIYDFTNNEWAILDAVSLGFFGWLNDTDITNSDYWSDTQLSMLVNSTDSDDSSIASIAYAEVTFYTDSSTWRDVTTATLYFTVEFTEATQWALNNWYILLGMGLVVASGIFLVKGGKDELSMNKFFYVIIAFMIGWALIIGGIMP